MACSSKGAIGIPSGLALVFSFIIFIYGIVIMTSTIPASKCGSDGSIGVDPHEKDSVDTALMYITWPLLLGGLLGLAGSAAGIFGGFAANKCGVCSAGILLGIAAAFVMIGSLSTMFFASIFSEMCNDHLCGSANKCGGYLQTMCSQEGVCCDQTHCLTVMCEETNDWACDLVGKKSGGTVVGFLGFIMILIATIMSCAGSCCCPAKFDGMIATSGGSAGGAAHPQAQVMGQVVGQPATGK